MYQKGKSTVCILRPYGEVVASPYEIQHTEPRDSCIGIPYPIPERRSQNHNGGYGAYHLPLLSSFKEAELFVSVINPLAMKKYASTAIRKGKTDKNDAVRIANYGIDHWFKLWITQCRMRYTLT